MFPNICLYLTPITFVIVYFLKEEKIGRVPDNFLISVSVPSRLEISLSLPSSAFSQFFSAFKNWQFLKFNPDLQTVFSFLMLYTFYFLAS